MRRYPNERDMSDLEREFELQMDEDAESSDVRELAEEFEALRNDVETPDEEFERVESDPGDYAERLYELSLREFESEAEVDDAVNELLNEMERDFFFKGLWKKLKRGGKWLLKKGMKVVKGLPVFQAVKGITGLARGILKGNLGSLAKAAIGALSGAIPGGAAILPALKALGFEATEEPESNREAWNNFVAVSREAYDYLGRNLDVDADDPAVASRLANEAFQNALKRVQTGEPLAMARRKPDRVIHIRKGDRIVIKAI